MGEMDKPAPWYVYVGSGLALTAMGCGSNHQWQWALWTALASTLVGTYGYWRFRRASTTDADALSHAHVACLERIYYLEKDLGFPITVPVPARRKIPSSRGPG